MVKKTAISALLIFFIIFPLSAAFSREYYTLRGKWVELNGPYCYNQLGVALDEAAYGRLSAALDTDSREIFAKTLQDYDIFMVRKGTPAQVLEVNYFDGKAKVMVYRNFYKRESGWVPLNWLDSNERRPAISDSVRKDTQHFRADPFLVYRPQMPR